MNLFKAIGAMLNSLTGVVQESGLALETSARTIRKTVEIAETAVDQMKAEQLAELEALKSENQPKS